MLRTRGTVVATRRMVRRMMVNVLLYAYATKVYRRGIAKNLEEDVTFWVLGAGNFMQHGTVCEFRRRHLRC